MIRAVQLAVILCLMHVWLPAESPAQPYVYCQKKWKELKWEGLKIQVLKLRAEQFPPGKTYTLFIRNCDGSETQVFDYTANKKGHLIIDIDDELKKGAPFAVTPLRKGEKVSYCMFSSDRSEEFMTSIVPFPIENHTDGATVSLELRDAKAEEFLCVGKGFSPGEELRVICTSGQQLSENILQADSLGRFQYLVWPSIEGEDSGMATLVVQRKNREISVPFVWGRQAQEFVGAVCLQIH